MHLSGNQCRINKGCVSVALRITAGWAKGRVIQAPAGKATRPTSAVLREALFGILAPKLENALVLDLFCGSGAMALEALSRGAQRAVLVDKDKKALITAKQNAHSLGMDEQCSFYLKDYKTALSLLKEQPERFDLIYIDPPYQAGYYGQALQGVFPHLVAPGGVVVLEHAFGDAMPASTENYQQIRTKKYGTRAITIYTGDAI